MSPVAIWWFLFAVLGSAWEMQIIDTCSDQTRYQHVHFRIGQVAEGSSTTIAGAHIVCKLTVVSQQWGILFPGGYLCRERCSVVYSMAYWRWFTFNIRGSNILQVDVATFSFCVSQKRRCLMLFRFLSVTYRHIIWIIYLIIYKTYGILIFSCSMSMCLVKPQTVSLNL